MWHEARKQEKKIRGMMVDYKRRAERRRDYYEKIKQDPAQFLQVHGRPAKIHLDPAVAIAADSPATMMPWQGHSDNLIDRFDVRAHLDIIPEYKPAKNDDEPTEDRQASYERYRTLVQNDFLGVGEDKFLHQIFMEERFGIFKPGPEDEKKKLLDKKAAIGYVYEDSTESPPRNPVTKDIDDEEENEDEKEEDLSDLDLDVTIDVSVLNPSQCAEMNEHSIKYGMVDDDFITYLLQDKDEADQLRLAREIEEEKAMYSGRKSRRERRALREKKLAGRKITSPPSYAARESPTYAPMRHSTSKSRSRSPPEAGKIMFITSFGGDVSDGEQNKSGSKNHISASKSGKTKSKDSSGSVIGPQLPSKNGDKKQPKSTKSSPHSDSSKSSHRSKPKESKSSRHSRGRSRRSRSSSSRSRSRTPPKKSSSRDKKRKSRRHSSSSRSRSQSSRSRSRSRPKSSNAKTRSRSLSKSKAEEKSQSPALPPPPVKSYYRHSLSRSNSEVSEESEGDKSPVNSSQLNNLSGSSKLQPLLGKAGPTTKGAKLTPQERLKRKMQIALKKQYKADKIAQMEKTEKQLQERQDRAEELREMAIKLRQRERERRHKMRGYGYDSDSDTTWTKNPDFDPRNPDSRHTKKSGRTSSISSSCSSDENSTVKSYSSSSRRRSGTKSPPHSSRRSPYKERKKSPPSYRKRSPLLRSPSRRNSPKRSSPRKSPSKKSSLLRSPPRNSSNRRSRSPHRSRKSPERRRNSRSRSSPSRRYSPSRSSSRKYTPSRSPSRSSSRQYRRGNHSSSRSRSPSRSYGSRPLVDY